MHGVRWGGSYQYLLWLKELKRNITKPNQNDWENWMINRVKGRIKNLKEYQSTDLVASIFLSTTKTFPPTTLTKLSGVSSVPNGANFVNAFLFQFCFVRNPFMSSWNYFNIKHKCTTTHLFNFIDHTLTKSQSHWCTMLNWIILCGICQRHQMPNILTLCLAALDVLPLRN